MLPALLFMTFFLEPSGHICDQRQLLEQTVVNGKPAPLYWNLVVGVPHVFMMCTLPDGELVSYTWSDNGVAQPNPGQLALANYAPESPPDWQVAGRNGQVPYISPGMLLVLKTPGLHAIRVTYGPSQRTTTFTLMAATAVCELDPDGKPRPSGWVGTNAAGEVIGAFGAAKIQVLSACK